MKKIKYLIFLLTLLTLNFKLLTQVNAQAITSITAIPPRLEITVEPGKAVTKIIKVRNESNSEKIISTSTKDFIVTDDKGTPIQLDEKTASTSRWAASQWIQISPTNLKLKPGETKSLTLTVIAPDDALAGGHYAMVLHTPNITTALKTTGSTVETNVGTLVYITIPGTINQEAKVTNFTATPSFSEFGPIDFSSTIKNLSDIHITPAGSIIITNLLGSKTKLTLDETNIFPNTSRDFTNTLDKKWLFGRYKAQINAAYGTAGGVLTATLFFWVIPWRLLILITTIIALVIALFILIKKNKAPPAEPTVPELEKELEDLKNKYKDK